MAEVKLSNVSKSYGNVRAVRNMDLTVADQEFLVFVGPSGCGKTTTLRMIAGLEEINEGDIYIDGVRVNDLAPRHRNVAVVFQNYALYPHMTVYHNMAYGLKRRKFKEQEIHRRVTEAARILGIENFLERHPGQLSGGQQQRVALGRAIVRQPAAFLFDEPLSALDAKLRVLMRAELSKLHDQLKSTMIYVTHDQVEAMTMGDRIVVMNKGVVQQVGTPKEVYYAPRNLFVAGFVGSPPMNMATGELRRDEAGNVLVVTQGLRLPLTEGQAQRAAPYVGMSVKFGIRAEDLHAEAIAGSENFPVVNMKVTVVEPLGFETHLYITNDHEEFVARVSPRVEPRVGEVVPFMFDVSKLHFFDAGTGDRLLI